ncbi:serine/threonine-protein kinase [Nonomuraea fastidiosa]|uniref:serine/threonine-protein kinase n=1 Tax=Nonomuraea fastidiosa TaxID=46173 RepID=UPI00366C0DA3
MTGPGTLIGGRYRLEHPLGQGGFGRVWKAHDDRLRADVVVKEVYLPPTLDEEDRNARLKYAEREARNAARLRHCPNIVPVYDVVIEDGRPWIIMELINGESLEDRMRTGPLAEPDVADLAKALLHALEAAHGAGVVHRDIKPANVMLAADGRIMLTDFGIAIHETDTRMTSTGTVIGSFEYMAPERFNGDHGSPASDLFSVGATLYQAAEGVSPFRRGAVPATIAAVLRDEPPPLTRATRLAPLLNALLAKDPGKRPSIPDALDLLRTPDQGPAPTKRYTTPVTAPTVPQETPEKPDPPASPPIAPQDAPAFQESWTGDERLSAFCWEEGPELLSWIFRGLAFIVATLVVIGQALGELDDSTRWVGMGVFAALMLVGPLANQWLRFTTKRSMPARSVRLDREGITGSDGSGVQTIPWTAIRQVTVRHTDDAMGVAHHPLALHVRLDQPGSAVYRPVGWPLDTPVPKIFRRAIEKDDWVPVCVLGPLSDPRRTDLKNALAACKGPLTADELNW